MSAAEIIRSVKVLIGLKGVYLCYYLADVCHVRLLGDPNPSCELWVDFDANPDSWLPLAALIIGAWEASIETSFLAVYPTRDGAWQIATAGEEKRDRAYVYSEYLLDGLWHVSTYMPKALA